MKNQSALKVTLLCLLALCMGLFAVPAKTAVAADKVIKWKMQSVYPKANVGYEQSVLKICRLLEEHSNGRLVVEDHPAGTLMPTKELFNATKRGVLPLAHTPSLYYRTKLPVVTIAAGLPFAFTEVWQMSYFLKFTGYEQAIKKAMLEQHGLYYFTDRASEAAFASKKPVRTIEDFKGLKMRTSGLLAKFIKALGGAASYATASESYSGLASGVFDAAMWGAAAGAEKMGFFEVAKYLSKPNIANVAYTTWVVNKKAFESLPKDIQKSFDVIFERHYWERTNQTIYDEAQTIGRVTKKGVEVVTLPKEDQRKMRQIAMKLWDDEAKADPELAKWMEKMKAYLRDIGEL